MAGSLAEGTLEYELKWLAATDDSTTWFTAKELKKQTTSNFENLVREFEEKQAQHAAESMGEQHDAAESIRAASSVSCSEEEQEQNVGVHAWDLQALNERIGTFYIPEKERIKRDGVFGRLGLPPLYLPASCRSPLQLVSRLKMHDCLRLIESGLVTLLFKNFFPKKQETALFGYFAAIREVTARVISRAAVPGIQRRLVRAMVAWEAVAPITDLGILHHGWCHIPPQIAKLGPACTHWM